MIYYNVSFQKGGRSGNALAQGIDEATKFANWHASNGYVATVYDDSGVLFILQPATEAELVLARVL